MAATRWGIVSAGKISQDFTTALQLLPRDEHQVVAVAARNLSDAQKFADRFKIPRAYGSYADLAADPNIDVVYVGTIHTTHVEISKMMLNANKPVLCEKPLGMNTRQITEVIELAKEKKLFFMEGFWCRFYPAYRWLSQALEAGTIGEPRVVNATFGFNDMLHGGTPRLQQRELGGGALMDVGCYTVQFANFIFKGKPEKIVASGVLTEAGVDRTTTVMLKYSGDRVATLTCSLGSQMCNLAIVQGTEGVIKVPTIWSPVELEVNDKRHEFPLPTCSDKRVIRHGEGFTDGANHETLLTGDKCCGCHQFPLPPCSEKLVFYHGEGFTYEAKHVRERLLKGDLESPVVPHADSLAIMGIMDEVRRQIGVHYPADSSETLDTTSL